MGVRSLPFATERSHGEGNDQALPQHFRQLANSCMIGWHALAIEVN